MAEPRVALAALVTAFERHLEACAQRRGEDDPAVVAAYDDLADAFEAYDDALLEAYGEMTPLDVYSETEEDVEDDDADEGGHYLGLDDEEFDEDDLDDDSDSDDDSDEDDGDDSDDEDDGDDSDDEDDGDDSDDEDDEDDDGDEPAAHPS